MRAAPDLLWRTTFLGTAGRGHGGHLLPVVEPVLLERDAEREGLP